MMAGRHLFTSESVAEGHPDKVSDQISDAVLDAILSQDKAARVDCETLIMQGTVVVTGQITTTAYANIKQIVRGVLKDIGFNNAKDGLDWETCGVLVSIEEQSPDISMGVNKPIEEMGAGDLIDSNTKFYVNSTGRFVIGGTLADSGLTGRKIIVDTYGGVGAHGGGCFSWHKTLSKDAYPTPEDFGYAYAKLLRKEVLRLKEAGVSFIQIDEPMLGDLTEAGDKPDRYRRVFNELYGQEYRGFKEELKLAVDLLNKVIGGIGGVRIGVHMDRWPNKDSPYFDLGYERFLPELLETKTKQFVLEYQRRNGGSGEACEGVSEGNGDRPRRDKRAELRSRDARAGS
jgi:S-adenosylmethionine synthetase, N-terminal domain/S-adenosylmethionine synthetase, C-terminal domain